MRQLWLAEDLNQETLSLSVSHRKRLERVLRLRQGATLIVADGCGHRRLFSLQEGHLQAAGQIERLDAPTRRVHVAHGLIKGERQNWALQKLTEVGADHLHPLALEHCVVRIPESKVNDRMQRWRQVLVEAFEQCGRSSLPQLSAPTDIRGLLKALPSGCKVAACDETPGLPSLQSWLKALDPSVADICLIVGPEGGLSKRERSVISPHELVSLGNSVLRAETAAIVAAWTANLSQ